MPPRPGLPNTSRGQASGWSAPGGSKVRGPQRPGWGAGGAGEDGDRDVRGRGPTSSELAGPRTESTSGTVGGDGREGRPRPGLGAHLLPGPPSQVMPPCSWLLLLAATCLTPPPPAPGPQRAHPGAAGL